MPTLVGKLIRIAHANPDERERLRPIIERLAKVPAQQTRLAQEEKEEVPGKDGKQSSLRGQLIRLAAAHPEFQTDLFPLIQMGQEK